MLDVAYRPFNPLAQLQDDLGNIFETAFDPLENSMESGGRFPAVNLWEHGDTATLEAELPGVALQDVELLATGNQITLKVQRRMPEQPDQAGRNWHRRERTFGSFTRTLTLPWELATDKVEASLKDGVLSVRLPKAESSKPRKIKLVTT